MSKHTPGPWHLGGIFMPGTPDETCDVWSEAPLGYQSGDQIAQHVRLADARLIAAAPDLLEALRDMVSDRNALSDATVEFARAAIAKATGERYVP